jgi:hypothetical protein
MEIEQKEISSALVKVLDVRNHPGNYIFNSEQINS